jgi:RND family efflux transporter MFP subunit
LKAYRLLALPLGLAWIALLLLAGCTQKVAEQPTPTPFPTQAALAKPTYSVARGEVVEVVKVSGRVVPVVEKELYFPINGRIRKLYVQKGDQVAIGQVIADLEGIDDLERQRTLREISIQRAQINAQNAEIALDIFVSTADEEQRNFDNRALYEGRLKMEQNNVLLAELAVQEAALGLQDLQAVISDTQLVSPMNGIITAISTAEGREVISYTPIGKVADLGSIEVRAKITGTEADRLAEGMAAIITPAGGLGDEIPGLIRALPVSTLSDATDDGLRVTVDESAKSQGYKIGDLVQVTIIIQEKSDALWLPPQAIRTYEGRNFVVVQDGDIQRRLDIKLGLIGENRVEILEGLEEGQTVVSP